LVRGSDRFSFNSSEDHGSIGCADCWATLGCRALALQMREYVAGCGQSASHQRENAEQAGVSR
jgi:hypothetical protein